MASTEKFAETEEKELKMELSSSETSCDSVLAKEVDLSGSTSSLCAAHENKAARDAAVGPPVEERSLQTSTKQPCSKGDCVNSSEKSSRKGDAPTCLHFLKKLWYVVESDRFESIRWGDNGKCVVINEDLFEEEVLARRGRLRIFESENMRSFTHHLRQHGFTRKLGIFPKSGSRSDLLAKETAREFHFYYNPNFRRHFPHQLMKYKQIFDQKNKKPAGFSPNMDLHVRRRKRKRKFEPTLETIPEDESVVFTPGPRKRPAQAPARARRTSLWARTAPCAAPRTAPCTAPGTAPGTATCTAPGTATSTTPGTATCTAPGTAPGTATCTAPGTAPGTAPCSAPCSSNGAEAHSSQHVPVAAARQPWRGTYRLSSCGGSSCCSLCAKATPVPRFFADKQSLQKDIEH